MLRYLTFGVSIVLLAGCSAPKPPPLPPMPVVSRSMPSGIRQTTPGVTIEDQGISVRVTTIYPGSALESSTNLRDWSILSFGNPTVVPKANVGFFRAVATNMAINSFVSNRTVTLTWQRQDFRPPFYISRNGQAIGQTTNNSYTDVAVPVGRHDYRLSWRLQ